MLDAAILTQDLSPLHLEGEIVIHIAFTHDLRQGFEVAVMLKLLVLLSHLRVNVYVYGGGFETSDCDFRARRISFLFNSCFEPLHDAFWYLLLGGAFANQVVTLRFSMVNVEILISVKFIRLSKSCALS